MKYEIVTINPYTNQQLVNKSKGIVIKDRWHTAYIKLIVENDIKTLFLNYAKGWSCDSYSFLENIPKLLCLDVIDYEGKDIAAVERQTDLIELSLNLHIGEAIDFKKFENLKTCYLRWGKNVNTIFENTALKKLYIDELKCNDTHQLGKLNQLEELTICGSNLSGLDFLRGFRKLRILELLDCRKIISFEPISTLKNLKRLRIDGYKNIGHLNFLPSLTNLEVLLLDVGEIDSIDCLKELKNLKAIAFSGTSTKIIDGNLEAFTTLPKLSMLMLADRKHYTHKIIKPWDWKNFDSPDVLLKDKSK